MKDKMKAVSNQISRYKKKSIEDQWKSDEKFIWSFFKAAPKLDRIMIIKLTK